MYYTRILIRLFLLLFVLTGLRCTYEKAVTDTAWKIALRWVPAYEDESWNDVRTGLLWSFSFLGATLPSGSFDASVKWVDDRSFICDFSKLGFSEEGLDALEVIFERLKETEEYETMGGIDIGRFLMLTLYSSHHYYKITGMNPSYDSLRKEYLPDSIMQFAVTNSTVSSGDRLIEMKAGNSPGSFAFYSAADGTGYLTDGSFQEKGHETFELMANGQLRFAIYDSEGTLETAAAPTISTAGKPGKCMWCHESQAQTLFAVTEDVPGYMTSQEFKDRIILTNEEITAIRNALSTDVAFVNKEDHTKSELLYISFMEPSTYRLANEWNKSIDEIENMLDPLPTHNYPEFPFLGTLYHRDAVDPLAPYESERVPESAREHSSYEPNFFH